MNFQALAPQLHATAIAARKHFSAEFGAKAFEIEAVVDEQLSLRPTLKAKLANGYILCVEVSDRAWSNSLDTFVLECVQKGFPVKFCVVVPLASADKDFSTNLKKAKDRGVGIFEIAELSKHQYLAPVSLSLFGLRLTPINDFPKPKREPILLARETFLTGNPAKGCQTMYEEFEALTRQFASRSHALGWWKAQESGDPKDPKDFQKDPWASVLRALERRLDMEACRKVCPKMSDTLIIGARSTTDPRNLTSHKPDSVKKLLERDKRLRTWFETSQDLLKDWLIALKSMKL